MNARPVISVLLSAVLLAGLVVHAEPAEAFWGAVARVAAKQAPKLGKVADALSEEEVVVLARRSLESKGVHAVGQILAAKRLSDLALADAYLRILIQQGKITAAEADDIFKHLHQVPGLRATLRKASGVNPAQIQGHLNEVRIANAAAKRGFTVVEIGRKWDDGIKNGLTDIDVLIEKGGKTFAVEAKDYASTSTIPMDAFRADMDTLVAFRKANGPDCHPIFTITNPPADPAMRRLLEKEAERRGVHLLYGSPDEQAILIDQLAEVLP